jgi:hypothetical protein
MKKQINYGELYFNREIDLQTNEKGYAIKIGIAQKERTSEDRLKDHQTGNSRKVYVESYIDLKIRFNIHTIKKQYFTSLLQLFGIG